MGFIKWYLSFAEFSFFKPCWNISLENANVLNGHLLIWANWMFGKRAVIPIDNNSPEKANIWQTFLCVTQSVRLQVNFLSLFLSPESFLPPQKMTQLLFNGITTLCRAFAAEHTTSRDTNLCTVFPSEPGIRFESKP